MSNLVSQEPLDHNPILWFVETSALKQLLIIYPFVRGLFLILLPAFIIHLDPMRFAKSVPLFEKLVPPYLPILLPLISSLVIPAFKVASLLDIQRCTLGLQVDPGL